MAIKMFVMDVDGTLTDGKIYMGNQGELFKAFDIKDGLGVHEILPEHGVKTVIMTGRVSEIVERRAAELEVSIVLQGIKDKKKMLCELMEKHRCLPEEVAYIGDDLGDIPAIKACKFSACPGDAVRAVKEECAYVCKKAGGSGAVREFIEWLLEQGHLE